MNAPTQLATLQNNALAAPRETVRTGFFDLQSFELTQRIAKAFASSSLVPKEYQGDVANCMIALNMAQRIGADPMQVMQSLVIVHGRPTWAAQFLIATANACGRFSALRFEFFGEKNTDNWGCRAYAIEKSTGERLEGADVTIAIAKSEGWYGKNGSKWKTIPQQMLMYRAGSWWVRAYAPEISMGLTTQEEAVDIIDITRGADGKYMADLETLRATPEQKVITEAPAAQAMKAPVEPQSIAEKWAKYDEVLAEYGEKEAENFMPSEPRPGTKTEQQATQQGDGYMSAEEQAAIHAAEVADAQREEAAPPARRVRMATTGNME